MAAKVWFITGSSRGLGRTWTEAALERGDKVAATARTLASIANFRWKYGENVLLLEVDVTVPEQVKAAVEQTHAHFGRLDVVLNNAGYPLVGTIEEAKLDEVRAQYETNIFGSLSVIQAVLPILRAQGHGQIIGISSTLGQVTMPLIGYYCSSKWAFEALHESLAMEVKPFGIHVTIVEPGAYATEFGGPASGRQAEAMDVYAVLRSQVFAGMQTMKRGDPKATTDALLQLVDTEQPPLRLFLGSHNLFQVRKAYTERLAVWDAWQRVAEAAQGASSTMS